MAKRETDETSGQMQPLAPRPLELSANEHTLDLVLFWNALGSWGRENFRYFPWRLNKDPYRILMAEIMLHRTQVTQVVPIYEAFLERFPDLPALLAASRDELHESMASLGLNWRIDLVYKMARELEERFGGVLPLEKDALLSLSGVSHYITNALLCFGLEQPEAIIDTNTVRIASRLFALPTKDSSRRNKSFIRLLEAMVDPEDPWTYNFALLDLAHLVCHKVQEPECEACPLRAICATAQESEK